MTSFGSPTDKPPIAYPGKSSDTRSRALCLRRSSNSPPWMMPNNPWSALRSCASRQRSAQREVRSTLDFMYSCVAGKGGHSSNAIMMSEPRSFWICIAFSGLKNSLSPFMWLRKWTPSSLMLRNSLNENTWNPPESVRIGRSQFMNLCRPPASLMTSLPGRSHKW